MTKEEAIEFLQEIKFSLDDLRTHYSQNLKAAEESAQQEKLRNLLIKQANARVSIRTTVRSLDLLMLCLIL